MNLRYIAWVEIKTIMGSLLMFDAFLNATSLYPNIGVPQAMIHSGNFAYLFAGFMLVLSGLIGGIGIMTIDYHLKGE